jgi:coenzyme F420-0:L-glutamate ligase/coenzyme F420-1:gamma-L-glutamate ligase
VNLEVTPVAGLPEVTRGARLGELIAGLVDLQDGDVVVVSQKIVSKAEGRVRRLADVEPTERAAELAAKLGKDPALTQLILDESRSIVRAERGVLITETRAGWVCANAGIDESNVVEGKVTLLPEDADASARAIRDQIVPAGGRRPGVVITDSFGRPWRIGQVDVAIGVAGLAALDDRRGTPDRQGRELAATVIAIADEVAAAADLVRDKTSGDPVALVRGLAHHVRNEDGAGAAELRRSVAEDLFR